MMYSRGEVSLCLMFLLQDTIMSVLTKLYSTTGPFRLVVGFLTKCGEGRFAQVVTNDRSIYRESSVIRVNGLLKPDVLFGVLNNLPKM